MAENKSCPAILFEGDTPVASFNLTEGGAPFSTTNYEATLLIVDPAGEVIASQVLESTGIGILAFPYLCLCEGFSLLEQDIQYSGQIFLRALNPEGDDIGLLDIVDPYWMDYVPLMSHIPLWESGVETRDRTVLTEIPWRMMESFRNRGSEDG
jgi:hypothetical protein